MKNRVNHAAIIRQNLVALIDEKEHYRVEAGQLRLAGLTLIKYLERLAKGKTAGRIQAEEVRAAVEIIRKKGT